MIFAVLPLIPCMDGRVTTCFDHKLSIVMSDAAIRNRSSVVPPRDKGAGRQYFQSGGGSNLAAQDVERKFSRSAAEKYVGQLGEPLQYQFNLRNFVLLISTAYPQDGCHAGGRAAAVGTYFAARANELTAAGARQQQRRHTTWSLAHCSTGSILPRLGVALARASSGSTSSSNSP